MENIRSRGRSNCSSLSCESETDHDDDDGGAVELKQPAAASKGKKLSELPANSNSLQPRLENVEPSKQGEGVQQNVC